jgi:hypothetical protein
MPLFGWPDASWRKRLLVVASLLLVVLFASHPELRLLLPLVDGLGLDLLLVLLGAQLWSHARPLALALYALVVRPALDRTYRVFLFFAFGPFGPHAHGRLSARFPALTTGS